MKIHIVQDGDTLQTIADKYEVGHDDLGKMNTQLHDPNQLAPGMKVKVPSGGVRAKTEKAERNETKVEENSSSQGSFRSEGKANEPKLYTHQEPKQEKQEAPETSWSFHYPPMNEKIPPFPPTEEMPESEFGPSHDFSPMYPPSFEGCYEEMQQWSQSASSEWDMSMHPYPMDQEMHMNAKMDQEMHPNPYTMEQGTYMSPYSPECLPQCTSLTGLYTKPILGAMPINTMLSSQQAPYMGYYQMPATDCGCSSSYGYESEGGSGEWEPMPYANPSWKYGHEKG